MKYIKNLILTVSGIAVAMGVSSCNSFLDMTPTDSVSDKMLWKTTANAEYGVNYIYSYILDMADALGVWIAPDIGELAPRPFLRPAVEANRAAFEKAMRKVLG